MHTTWLQWLRLTVIALVLLAESSAHVLVSRSIPLLPPTCLAATSPILCLSSSLWTERHRQSCLLSDPWPHLEAVLQEGPGESGGRHLRAARMGTVRRSQRIKAQREAARRRVSEEEVLLRPFPYHYSEGA